MEERVINNDFHLQVEGLSLIDFSSENDALFLNSSAPICPNTAFLDRPQSTENQKNVDDFEPLGKSLGNGKGDFTPSCDQDDQLPSLNESLEQDRATRKAKYNLRKSLAWDSAFFTSDGVLDPEELSCMIKGVEKSEKQILPGIQEDFRRSTETTSTLESDDLIMENLDAELFEDIRASIQKSSKAFTAASKTCKATSGEGRAISCLDTPSLAKKKMNCCSQNQRQQPALRKSTGVSKSDVKQTLRIQGTAREAKQDAVYSQVAESVVRPVDTDLTLPKPPRVINKGKPNPTITEKRASLAASQAKKIENDKMRVGTVADKRPQASMKPAVTGARRVLLKHSSSSRASSLDSSNSIKSVTSPLTDSSESINSDKVKPHMGTGQRKIRDRTVNPPSSGSILKTPLKTATRNSTTSGNSAVSAYLISSKISSSISPASSISGWSSASSSSSCTINPRSNKSGTSFDTNSCRSSEHDTTSSDFNDHYSSHMSEKHKNEVMVIHNGDATKSSMQAGNISRPDPARPSGLRMPSPKIGFFDGAKSVRTPNGSMQSHASLTVLPKVGTAIASPNRGSSMKPKIGKLSHARTVSASAKMNPVELTSTLSAGEKSHASVNVYDATCAAERCPMLSLEVNDDINGESCLKAEKAGGVHDQVNHVGSAALGSVTNEKDLPCIRKSEKDWDMDGVVGSEDNNIVAAGDTYDLNTEGKDLLRPLKKVDRDDQDTLFHKLHTLLRYDEKENTPFTQHMDEFNSTLGV